ncbi:transglutaminase domain-containing protein [Candidatus Dependentiae bacterium]|nr:transglutaminase domain-containing protein [Candidatus Dependentiae bacterium]
MNQERDFKQEFQKENLIYLYIVTLGGFFIAAFSTFKYLKRLDEFILVLIFSVILSLFSLELRKARKVGLFIDNIIGLIFIGILYNNFKLMGSGAFFLKDVLAISMVWGATIFTLSLTQMHRFKTMGIISLILLVYSASVATDIYILVEIFIFLIFFLSQLMLLSNSEIKKLDGYQKIINLKFLTKSLLVKIISLDVILFLFAIILYITIPQFWNESSIRLRFSINDDIIKYFQQDQQNARVNYSGFSEDFNISFARTELSDRIVMLVETGDFQRSKYIRGLVYDQYTGQGWEISDGMKRIIKYSTLNRYNEYSVIFRTADEKLSELYNEVLVKQTFTIIAPQPNVVFGAYKIGVVRIGYPSIRKTKLGNIWLYTTLNPGVKYSVVSYVKDFNYDKLKDDGEVKIRGSLNAYVQLPDIPERLREKTFEIVEGKESSYEKVLAIQEYLLTNYKYTLDTTAGSQDDVDDVVDYFIFNMEGGYCEQFATAMVVMCRIINVPARVVTGYAGGEYNWQEGEIQIREYNAHAWVEIFFTDFAWVTFDPTPPGFYQRSGDLNMISRLRILLDKIFNIDPQILIPKRTGVMISRFFVSVGNFIKNNIVLIIIVLTGLIIFKYRKKIFFKKKLEFSIEYRNADSVEVIRNYHTFLKDVVRKKPFTYEKLTPDETLMKLKQIFTEQSEELKHIVNTFILARYSRKGVTSSQKDAFLKQLYCLGKKQK